MQYLGFKVKTNTGRKIMRILFLSIILLLTSLLFAQNEQGLSLNQQELYFPIATPPLTATLNFQQPKLENIKHFNSLSLDTLFQLNKLYFTKLTEPTTFSFSQDKREETFIGLGNYEHFNNRFIFNKKDKLLINLEMGLIKQNTIQDFNLNFHLSMRTLIEYKINKTLSAYMYGQYISAPLNQNNSSFDSFSYMNPLFLQTEIGTGLRASYKNFKTDVGMKSMHDNQFNQIKSINTMNTKITIGF